MRLILFLLFSFATVAVFGQDTVPEPPVPVDVGFITQLINVFSGKYGIVAAILGSIAGLRLVFKPAMTWLHSAVEATPTKADDEALAKVEASAPYRWFAWALDYLTSIKIGPQK